jgi:hypothetical protein
VREVALARLRKQIALALQGDLRSATTDQLARFALAAFDGAFVASQSDRGVTLQSVLDPRRFIGRGAMGARAARRVVSAERRQVPFVLG